MSKTKLKILLSILLVLFITTSYCFATEQSIAEEANHEDNAQILTSAPTDTEHSDDIPGEIVDTTQAAEWKNSDLYLFQTEANVTGIIDGNAYVMGNEVTISAEIGGDLFVIANKLNIDKSSRIYNSVFVIANEITVDGVVYDVYAACSELNLTENGYIYRDLHLVTSNLNISGVIRRNAFVTASNINISDKYGQLIGGDFNYSSGKEANIPEGVVVGEIKYSENVEDTEPSNPVSSYILNLFKNLLLTFVITLVLLWLAPKFVEKLGNTTVKRALVSLGIGIVAPIALIIASVILIISVVGISIFACAMFAFAILAFIGTSITCIYFGKLFTNKLKMEGKIKLVLFTLLSCLIIWLVSLIPTIGGIVSFLVSVFGIGLTIVNIVMKENKKQQEIINE